MVSKLKSEEYAIEHSKKIHSGLLKVIAIYSIAFFFINLYYDDYMQAYATIIALPFTLFSYYLFKIDKYYLSKLINYIQLNLIITSICLITGMDSLVFMYYFPLIIGALVMFQGKEKTTGYVLVFSTITLMCVLTYLDLHLDPMHNDYAHLQSDKLMNSIGVGVFCLVELIYFIKYSNETHDKLVSNAEQLELKNNQLLSVIYTRDKMMSVISHDLRSPIIALNSAMNVFSEQAIDPSLQIEIVGQIKNKSGRLLVLIDDLLNWTKSQSAAIDVKIEKLEISYFNDYASSLLSIMDDSKNLELEYNKNGVATEVYADKNLMDAIFRNLISNAIKFSNKGSKIQLNIDQTGNQCKISIRDFGKGMSEKEITDFKNGASFSTKGTASEIGYGLGLQLVKEFLHKQNSELLLESHIGFGSRFYFVLPIAE